MGSCTKGGGEESPFDGTSSTEDGAMLAEGAAFFCLRGATCETGGGAAGESSEFGEEGLQGPSGLLADADQGSHDVGAGFEVGRGGDEVFDLRFDGFDVAIKEGEAIGKRLSDGFRGGGVTRMVGARFFGHLGGDEIGAAHHQLAEALLVLRGEFEAAQAFVPLGGEAGEGLGVEAIGLGGFAERAGEAMGLPGGGTMQGDLGHDECGDQGCLITAGSLQNDEAVLQLPGESGAKVGDTIRRVGEPPGFLRAFGESDIKPVLADVDAEEVYKVQGIISVLSIVCGRETLPTIQAVRKRGWAPR